MKNIFERKDMRLLTLALGATLALVGCGKASDSTTSTTDASSSCQTGYDCASPSMPMLPPPGAVLTECESHGGTPVSGDLCKLTIPAFNEGISWQGEVPVVDSQDRASTKNARTYILNSYNQRVELDLQPGNLIRLNGNGTYFKNGDRTDTLFSGRTDKGPRGSFALGTLLAQVGDQYIDLGNTSGVDQIVTKSGNLKIGVNHDQPKLLFGGDAQSTGWRITSLTTNSPILVTLCIDNAGRNNPCP